MRYLPLVLILFAGCALGGRQTLTGTSPEPVSDLFTRASQELVSLGYAIQNADRDAGFIVAEKQSGRRGFGELIDVIRVSLAAGSDSTSFNVTASTDAVPLTGDRRSDRPTRTVLEDAEVLRRALGGGW